MEHLGGDSKSRQQSEDWKIAAVIAHQAVATVGLFLVTIAVASSPNRSSQWSDPPVPQEVADLILAAALALAAGLIAGYFFPGAAHLGYWSWVIPTVGWVVLVVYALSHGRNPFSFLVRGANSDDTPYWLWTMLWVQSILYAAGLRVKELSNRSAS